jgi:hypothetical protein
MIPATVRIFVYTEAVDMRRGFCELALIAREAMEQDPLWRAVHLRQSPR